MTPTDMLSPVQQPTVFQKLLEPVEPFVREQNQQLSKHPNQKYEYYDFFRLLIDYFVGGTQSLKLLINTRLNRGQLPAELGLRPVPYSTPKRSLLHRKLLLDCAQLGQIVLMA